jgi:4a-hydroxytetrahydrobiopterin dehydratase
MTTPLAEPAINAALAALPGWQRDGEALVKTFVFADFRTAMAFQQEAVEPIEAANHHPEWTNVYQRMVIRLTTHDAGNRITAKDVEVAKILEWLAQRFGA